MRRFIDLDDLIYRKRITGDPVTSELAKRALTIPLEIQFTRNGVVVEPDAGEAALTGVFGLKEAGKYDATSYVVSSINPSKTGTGANAVYKFLPNFDSPALDALFNKNGTVGDDVPVVSLMAEIQFTYSAGTYETVNAFDVVVNNNVIRGGESSIVYPSTAATVTLYNVDRIAGGNILTDLDAQALAGYPTRTLFDIVIDIGGGVLSNQRYQKRSGSTPTGGGFVLCQDGTQLIRVG